MKMSSAKGASVIFIPLDKGGRNMQTVINIIEKLPTPIRNGSLTFEFFDNGLPESDNPILTTFQHMEELELAGRKFVSQMIKNHADSNKPVSCIISNPFFPWVLG